LGDEVRITRVRPLARLFGALKHGDSLRDVDIQRTVAITNALTMLL